MLKYYKILNVKKTDTLDEIKKQYRKLCLKYHPDKTFWLPEKTRKEYEEKFKEITLAFKYLSIHHKIPRSKPSTKAKPKCQRAKPKCSKPKCKQKSTPQVNPFSIYSDESLKNLYQNVILELKRHNISL